MFDDLTKSFDKGKPKEEKEFMDSGNLRNRILEHLSHS